jgi:anti-anti-sigma factor
MSATSLRCYVDRTSPWPVVRVDGELDVTGAVTLRRTVLKCLADEPAAIVLDLTGLTGTDDTGLTSLITLARAAAAWPAIPLVAHSASSALQERMRALAVTRTVTVVPDADAAATHLAAARGPGSVRIDLITSHDLAAVRDAVRRVCDRTGPRDVADTMEIVATELATNALCHAAGPRSVIISASLSHVQVAVRDHSDDLPYVEHNAEGEHGRGMRIVEALSAAWGSTPTHDGKVVWAAMRWSITAG